MNAMTISFVLVRLAATFLLVRGIQGLAAFSYLLTGQHELANFGALTLVFSVMLPIAIAIVLWTHPEKVAGAQQTGGKQEGPMGADQVLMIGLSLMGLYMLVYGIVDLFAFESAHLYHAHNVATGGLPDLAEAEAMLANRVRYSVQIALGLALLLGRRGITGLLLRARYAAVMKSSTADEPAPLVGNGSQSVANK